MTRMKTTPVPVQRTTRRHDLRVLTSLPAGKMVPIAAIPLLREDSLTRCNVRLSFEMAETVELLMNAINVRTMAYLVPKLAFDRYDGMDQLNRSWSGVGDKDGGTVTPWFETVPVTAMAEILTYMGKHARNGSTVNTDYIEAYNQIWNYRAKNRSKDITLRNRLDFHLAPAFWQHQNFAHIVPDFDQASMEGEVALTVTNGKFPVKGLAYANVLADNMVTWKRTSNQAVISSGDALKTAVITGEEVFAEMAANGVSVSLANIDLARRTQAFAELRRQYNGHSDEYIIDMLMDGLSVPEQAWRSPMLLSDQNTVFGMSKRYASDAGNLTESVVNGETFIDMSFAVPRCPTSGVVMIVAEITPEQLFERMKDPYLHAQTANDLPQFLRDTLDPEKVAVVPNDYVDIDHDTPTNTFGYAPLGYQWNQTAPQIGGRFYRPAVDAAFDEDRQRIWAVETQNPKLSSDFYLCTTMHQKPFVVTNQDPFEVVARGEAIIRGNTVFGGALIEATNDYAEVMAEAPIARIKKQAS